MADFKVLNTIDKDKFGVLLTGFKADDNEISIGDFISIPYGKAKVDIQIVDITGDFEKLSDKEQLGLLISTEDFEKIKNYNLDIDIVTIMVPVRGLDIQLAAKYGTGAKWWAGPLLLVIIIVIALVYYLIVH
jgi:hypothetical protein